jgi:hypothetical protein
MSKNKGLVSGTHFQAIIDEGIRICGGLSQFASAIGLATDTLRAGLTATAYLTPLTKAKILAFGRRSRLWPFEEDPAYSDQITTPRDQDQNGGGK